MVDWRVCFWLVVHSVILLFLPLCIQASNDYARQEEDSLDGAEGSAMVPENMSNSTTTTSTSTPPPPILTASAIANIICGALAIAFLTGYLCFLMYSFNQSEHKSRVRTALENNRRIDAQIAKAKARAEAQLRREEAGRVQSAGDSETALMVSPGLTSASDNQTSDQTSDQLEPFLAVGSSTTTTTSAENKEALNV